MDGYYDQIKEKNLEELISDIKNNRNLSLEQQGIIIIRIMDLNGFTRHKEAADLLDVSRSYVSIRIKKARDKYPEIPFLKKAGRPRHEIIDLEELFGEIPLRITVKVGELPKSEIIRLLQESVKKLNDYEGELYASSPYEE